MKKIYTGIIVTFLMNTWTYADIVVISVRDFQFSPANVNVNIGDIVRFNFVSIFHNATTNNVTGGLPAGAVPVFSGEPGNTSSYDYTVEVDGTYKYICELHGDPESYTGMVGQFTASAPIPVVLKQFTVTENSKQPFISWITETELNADHFSIRRSIDGVTFVEIAKMNAMGNSTTQQVYSFTDKSISASDRFIYYAIAIIDKDGKQKLSPIKLFKNVLAISKLINNISPNPISKPGQLMVYFNSDKTSMMKVKIFNIEGKLVNAINMEAFPGVNSGHIHVCNFNAGTYTLVFSLNGLKETKRIVVN